MPCHQSGSTSALGRGHWNRNQQGRGESLFGRLTPRRWRRSGPPRLAKRSRSVGCTAGTGGFGAGRALFRRSSSRKARYVAETLDRLSQNSGGKLGLAEVLALLWGGSRSSGSALSGGSEWGALASCIQVPSHGPLPNLTMAQAHCLYRDRH